MAVVALCREPVSTNSLINGKIQGKIVTSPPVPGLLCWQFHVLIVNFCGLRIVSRIITGKYQGIALKITEGRA